MVKYNKARDLLNMYCTYTLASSLEVDGLCFLRFHFSPLAAGFVAAAPDVLALSGGQAADGLRALVNHKIIISIKLFLPLFFSKHLYHPVDSDLI